MTERTGAFQPMPGFICIGYAVKPERVAAAEFELGRCVSGFGGFDQALKGKCFASRFSFVAVIVVLSQFEQFAGVFGCLMGRFG